jgi:hypothetical protein
LKKLLQLFFFLCLLHVPASAQGTDIAPVNRLDYAVLRDAGYTVEEVAGAYTSQFAVRDSLSAAHSYWLRIILENPADSASSYVLSVKPDLQNTLFSFSEKTQKWIAGRSGILDQKGDRLPGQHTVILAAKSTTALYIKMDLSALKDADPYFKPEIYLTRKAVADRHERYMWTAWVAGMSVLVLFSLLNLHILISFRDISVLYYLIAQVGGMLYLTAYRWIFHIYFPQPIFSFSLHGYAGYYNTVGYYDINRLCTHMGIILVLYGFIHFTRIFLNTGTAMPGYDKLLRISLYTYISLSLCGIAVNVSGFYLERYTLVADNIFFLAMMLSILATAVVAYRRKLPSAKPFLVAHLVPILLLLAMPLVHIFVSFTSDENIGVAELAVASHAFTFTVALLRRTRKVKEQSAALAGEKEQLDSDLREISRLYHLNERAIEKRNAEILSGKRGPDSPE